MAAIFRFVTEPNALVFIGANSNAGTTVTIPTHRAGDLIVISAFRNGSTTAPTLPGSWTNVVSGGSDGCSLRVGRIIATASTTTSGTWTNATHLTVEVWRGVDATTPIGASAQAGGTGTAVSIPALTLQKTDGTSVVGAGYGHTASTSFTTPDGMTQRVAVGSGPRSALSDTNGGVFTYETRTVTASTSGGWRAAAFEVRAKSITVLDLNTGGLKVKDGDFTLGAPQWTSDPDTVNGDDGYREARMTVGVDNSYTSAADTISSLSRVLQQPSGWFMFQRETEHRPMFLRWYRTPPEEMDWQHAYIDTYRLPVRLVCDPYLRAEPQDLGTFTVTNNPVSGTNKASIALPAVKGDAPAPLKVDVVPVSVDWTGYEPFMSSHAYISSQAWTAPIVWDLLVAQWTAGTDTGGDGANANLLGGSGRACTFATDETMQTRLTGGPASAPIPGLYKVLMRVLMTTDLTTIRVRLGQSFNVTQVRWGDTKTIVRPNVTQTTWATWVDMGEFAFPLGAESLDASDIGGVTAPSVVIQAERVDGTASLHFDAILLIPISTAATAVDSVTQRSRFHGFGIETDRSGVWDGEKQRFNAYDFGINLSNIRKPEIRGGWLQVVPGANNVVHVLQQSLIDTPFFTNINDSDVITQTADVTLSCLPRYLHLRPDDE